jgi:hypothetical protein
VRLNNNARTVVMDRRHAKIQGIDERSYFTVENRDGNGIVRPGSVLELISHYQ